MTSEKNKKLAIIGIDPGVNFGVAILYLDNSFKTIKFLNPNEIDVIKFIQENSNPILIATDVEKTPEIVKKIANFFGVEVFNPKRDLPKKIKSDLTKNLDIKSDHERDALAAAKIAYKLFERKIKKALDGFEKFKAYFIKNMIRGEFPEITKTISIANNSVKKIERREKEKIKKIIDIVIVEKVIEKEDDTKNLLYLAYNLLKENKIPIFPLNKKNIKEWLDKYGDIIRDFPILVKYGYENEVKPYLEEFRKLNIPYLVLERNYNINYPYFLKNNINVCKFSGIYYIKKDQHSKLIAKIIKDRYIKLLQQKFYVKVE